MGSFNIPARSVHAIVIAAIAALFLVGWPAHAEDDPSDRAEQPATEQDKQVPALTPRLVETQTQPVVKHDLDDLPFAARRMHELLKEAAASGEIEKLRPYIGSGDDQTLFSFGGNEGDPVDFLKSLSGDDAGHEILAILQEVLEAGYVHIEPGTENELYVWPYFFGIPLESLTPPQRVELYRLLTHGDYLEMQSFGAYIFYRVGITPEGRWRFFVAGD